MPCSRSEGNRAGNGATLAVIPGIEDRVKVVLSGAVTGGGSQLDAAGLIPSPAAETATVFGTILNLGRVGQHLVERPRRGIGRGAAA
ncbi:MAG: hypothetical protein Kow0013_19710 [Pararhodobacter sp.]